VWVENDGAVADAAGSAAGNDDANRDVGGDSDPDVNGDAGRHKLADGAPSHDILIGHSETGGDCGASGDCPNPLMPVGWW
jgi:hypothetical protein